MSESLHIQKPYVIFLGDAGDDLAAKVGAGIAVWRPQDVIGQIRLADCRAHLNLPSLSPQQAHAAGAKTLVIGVANRGGRIATEWLDSLLEALRCGLDIASGLHHRLSEVEVLKRAADKYQRRLIDVRVPQQDYPVGSGLCGSGKRLLTVGTDCSVGKMFTALAIEKEMQRRGMQADFRATGQTGILINGNGVPLDAVVADFISGAIESLCPHNSDQHWDIVEGQGSLWHPSFAGVSLGLLHGSRAEYLILCHEPTRTHMRGLPHCPIADIATTIEANEWLGRRTNANCRVVGLSINTAALDASEARRVLQSLSQTHNLPATDPYRFGSEPLVDALL